MTSRTHDLAAFTSLTLLIHFTDTLPTMTFATIITAFGANFLGGLFPDLDKPTTSFWAKFRGGPLIARLISPLLGGHRLISHSLLGLILAGFLLTHILTYLQNYLLVDMNVVWWSFMIGVVSHLIMDSLTKEGIPLFFPLPWKIGFPPFRFLRITTGSVTEKAIVFPLLLLSACYFLFENRLKLLTLFHLIPA